MLTATVVIDLTDCPTERMRNKVTALGDVPTGARAVIRVGALTIDPPTVRALVLHERRLHLDIQGTPFAVRRWLEAVRDGLGEVLL